MAKFDWQLCFGYIVAFAIATAVILIDCNNALRKGLKRVPVNILKSMPVWFIAALGGAVAAVCFQFSYADWLKQVVDLKWENPILRGFLVGVAVLTILRSKFFNVKDSEFGGEFLYNLGRSWALKVLWHDWVATKNAIASDVRITAAINRPAFEAELDEAMRETLQPESDDDKNWVKTQFENVRKIRPEGSPDASDPKWRLYYRTLIKLALDCGGIGVLSGVEGFP